MVSSAIYITGHKNPDTDSVCGAIALSHLKNKLGIKNNLPIVLVFGGSQGAQKINEAILGILKNKLNFLYNIILNFKLQYHNYNF